MNKKTVIIIVMVVVVIIICIVAFLIYRKNQQRKEEDAKMQLAMLQAQLSQQPNMPAAQKQTILQQIAGLADIIMKAKAANNANTSSAPLPGLGGPGYVPTSGPITSVPAPAGFPLKKGSKGNYVADLQRAINFKCGDKLKSAGMSKLSTDGDFGSLTEKGAATCLGSTVVTWEQYQREVTPIILMTKFV